VNLPERSLAEGVSVTTIQFAQQIGAKANSLIRDANRSWSVLASVSGAIYIESDAGEILWIAVRSSALHSRAILLSDMPTKLPTVGAECFLEDDCLRIGASLVIRLCDAELWSPEMGVDGGVSASGVARDIMAAIGQAALQSPPQGLLAPILLPHEQLSSRSSLSAIEQALLPTAGRAIESLCHTSSVSDLREALQDAINLVGLGHGLTPAGDDLLGAFLYTLHVLDSAHLELIGINAEVVDRWLEQIRSRTDKISFAILADHAHGDAAAPLQDFLRMASDGQPLETLIQAAGRVAAIGQSSGWDMLAGVHCACAAVERITSHDPAG